MRDIFARTLSEVAKTQSNVFVVLADESPRGSMDAFREEFPDRFINVGRAEHSLIGVCAGLAVRGHSVFACSAARFSVYRLFEQIRLDLCCHELPVTVVSLHQAEEDIAVMGALTQMAIVAPCDLPETEAATRACAERQGPTYLRLEQAGEPNLTVNAPEAFLLGKLRLIKPGVGTCILSYGPVMKTVMEMTAGLERVQGPPMAVFSAHTLKPLDVEGMARVLKHFHTVVVVEEHSEWAGLAARVKQIAWESGARCTLHTYSLSKADALSAERMRAEILQGWQEKSQGRNQADGAPAVEQTAFRRAS